MGITMKTMIISRLPLLFYRGANAVVSLEVVYLAFSVSYQCLFRIQLVRLQHLLATHLVCQDWLTRLTTLFLLALHQGRVT